MASRAPGRPRFRDLGDPPEPFITVSHFIPLLLSPSNRTRFSGNPSSWPFVLAYILRWSPRRPAARGAGRLSLRLLPRRSRLPLPYQSPQHHKPPPHSYHRRPNRQSKLQTIPPRSRPHSTTRPRRQKHTSRCAFSSLKSRQPPSLPTHTQGRLPLPSRHSLQRPAESSHRCFLR